MAERPKQAHKGRTAVAATLLAVCGWMAGPALAAPEPDLICADKHDATLDVSATELSARPANSSNELPGNRLLIPRVEAAAREVFEEEDRGTDGDDATDEAAADKGPEPVSRRLSNTETTPFRRQMYRRDI